MPFDTSRPAALSRLAKRFDLNYFEKDEYGLRSLLKDFRLFKKGYRRRITNILREKKGLKEATVIVFDYQYKLINGNSTYEQTVFFVQSKALDLPSFYMEPENFFHQLSTYLGVEDIDFETHPKFSKQYWLKSEEEDRLVYRITDQVLHFFTIEEDWSLEGDNFYLIFYKEDHIIPVKTIKGFMKKGKKVMKLFLASR